MHNIQDIKSATFIAIFAIILSATVLSCKEGQGEENPAKEPASAVRAFCKAMVRGDFTQAATLCDGEHMHEYISGYTKAWELQHNKDSKTADIAAGILSSAEIAITDIVKSGDKRQVFYTIETNTGLKKEKIATVKKEEGEWRVEAITDRH